MIRLSKKRNGLYQNTAVNPRKASFPILLFRVSLEAPSRSIMSCRDALSVCLTARYNEEGPPVDATSATRSSVEAMVSPDAARILAKFAAASGSSECLLRTALIADRIALSDGSFRREARTGMSEAEFGIGYLL